MVPQNVTKVLSNVMLELYNVRMKPSNVRKKIRKPPNVTKVQSNVILELYNVRMKPLNVRKKNMGTIKCKKSTVICDIGIAQCEDGTIKYEKKIREPSNVTKI